MVLPLICTATSSFFTSLLVSKEQVSDRNSKPGISVAAGSFWSQHSYQEYGSPILTQPSAIIIVFKERMDGYE